jgi:hypothetical protein
MIEFDHSDHKGPVAKCCPTAITLEEGKLSTTHMKRHGPRSMFEIQRSAFLRQLPDVWPAKSRL